MHNVSVSTPDEIDPTLRFDTIWSNPPIRVGKEVLHNILLTWLPQLAPGGAAYLVVQKNLGSDSLQKWLDAQLTERFWIRVFGISICHVEGVPYLGGCAFFQGS